MTGDGDYARAPDEPFGPDEPIWTYNPLGFDSPIGSSAQRLPGGNTFICAQTTGRLFEVTPEGETVWDYVNPVGFEGPLHQGEATSDDFLSNWVNRARHYGVDHPGLVGRELDPRGRVELDRLD